MNLAKIPYDQQQQSLKLFDVLLQGFVKIVDTFENPYYQAATGNQMEFFFEQLGIQKVGEEAIAQKKLLSGVQVLLFEAQNLALQATQATFAGGDYGINPGTQLIIEQANKAVRKADDLFQIIQDTGFLIYNQY